MSGKRTKALRKKYKDEFGEFPTKSEFRRYKKDFNSNKKQ